jgi:soluble lytic murein transglycosylase-like protein
MRRLALALALLLAAPAARAELAVLANGQVLKVVSQRREAGLVTLGLPGGGELGLPEQAVRGVLADEIVEEVVKAAEAAVAASPSSPLDLQALVAETARRHGLAPELVMAVISVESGFEPKAVSPKGAQGLMQLMPATAKELGVADPLDPAANVDGGTRYLRDLVARYGGDLRKALAAYNAGMGAVARHGGVPPYKETREYVDRVLKRYEKGRP